MILAVGNTKAASARLPSPSISRSRWRSPAATCCWWTGTNRAPPSPSPSFAPSGREAGYTAVALTGAALRSQVRQLASKYDDIIIDVGGRDTGSLRAALTVADTLLVPVQPRSFDVWALDQVSALVAEAREINEGLRAVAVLNGADAQGADNEAALEMIGDIDGIEALPTSIVRRKAFPNAAAEGRAVIEQSPRDAKAVDELTALIGAVCISK